jgi:predicted porin
MRSSFPATAFRVSVSGPCWDWVSRPVRSRVSSTAQAGLNYGQGNFLIGAVAGVSSVPGSDNQYATKRLAGAGAKLTLDRLALYGSYTQVHFDGLVSYAARGISWKGARVDLDIGADYQFTPVVNGGLSWQHQTRNSDLGAADQVTASLSYSLSKRTSLYSTVAYQRDRAFGAVNVFGAGTPSSNGVQSGLARGHAHGLLNGPGESNMKQDRRGFPAVVRSHAGAGASGSLPLLARAQPQAGEGDAGQALQGCRG